MLTNKIFYLIKANTLNSFYRKRSHKIAEKIKIGKLIFMAILAFLYLFVIFVSTTSYYGVGKLLESTNQTSVIIAISFILVSIICLFMSLYIGITFLFNFKDYDMLKAMPVTNGDIFASKVIQIYNSNMLWCLAIGYPAVFIFNLLSHANIGMFLLSFIMFLFIPILPMVIGCIISLAIGLLIVKTKLGKFFTFVGTILFVGASIFLNILVNVIIKSPENSDIAVNSIDKTIDGYFLINYFVNGISQLNFFNILIFLLINIVILFVFIIVFGKLFSKINGLMQEYSSVGKYEMKTLPQSSKIKALYKKEIMLYTEYVAYVTNSALLPILMLVYFVIIFIKGSQFISDYLGIDASGYLLLINTAISIYIFTLGTTTSSSISIEGIRFYIMKTLPITFEEMAIGKILISATIVLPILFICSILMYISSNISIIEYFSYLTVTISYWFLSSVIGLFINLLFPKMEWKSETEVVKRGISVVIAILINMVTLIIPTVIYFIVKPTSAYVYLYILGFIVAIIGVATWSLLKKQGDKLIKKL